MKLFKFFGQILTFEKRLRKQLIEDKTGKALDKLNYRSKIWNGWEELNPEKDQQCESPIDSRTGIIINIRETFLRKNKQQAGRTPVTVKEQNSKK